MKLVVLYTDGDGCTWHQDYTLPVEYESEEAFLVDFETECLKARDKGQWNFKLAGQMWSRAPFFDVGGKHGKFIPPEVLTLENWFENYKDYY